MTDPGESSPEAAGIFRISHAQADPDSTGVADAASDGRQDGPVPLPSRRPRHEYVGSGHPDNGGQSH